MDNEEKKEEVISSTSDLNLASFILASGYEDYTFRKVVDTRGKQRLTFDFKIPEDKFMELKQSYASGVGKVSALKLVNAQRHFKNICFM